MIISPLSVTGVWLNLPYTLQSLCVLYSSCPHCWPYQKKRKGDKWLVWLVLPLFFSEGDIFWLFTPILICISLLMSTITPIYPCAVFICSGHFSVSWTFFLRGPEPYSALNHTCLCGIPFCFYTSFPCYLLSVLFVPEL